MKSQIEEGRWIRHPADRLNVARAFVAPPLLFLPFYVSFPEGFVLPYAILLFLILGKSNYLLHLHIHRPFCRLGALNLLVDLALG